MTRHLPPEDLRALALDVDGTLLSDEHVVTDASVQAVARARSAGVVVILTSARHPAGLAAIQKRLGLQHEWFVACQGAVVGRQTSDGKWDILSESTIDPYQALSIEELARHQGLSVGRFTGNHWFVREIDAPIEDEMSITGAVPEIISGDLLSPQSAPHKMIVACARDDDTAALQDFARRLPLSLSGSFSHPYMLEITLSGVDKFVGLSKVLKSLEIPLATVAAVGDGHNDITMLRSVGYSFAMGNASPAVRAAAGWATAANSDEGVARAIDQLFASPNV
jgi:Cof subfamily protein (haloacid dehalogenase superfamily)